MANKSTGSAKSRQHSKNARTQKYVKQYRRSAVNKAKRIAKNTGKGSVAQTLVNPYIDKSIPTSRAQLGRTKRA